MLEDEIEFDTDTLVWTFQGKPMRCIGRNINGRGMTDIYNWCDEHITGKVVVTPIYVCFEHEVEATLFKLGFIDD